MIAGRAAVDRYLQAAEPAAANPQRMGQIERRIDKQTDGRPIVA